MARSIKKARSKKPYVVIAGEVRSRTDGVHWVSGPTIADLYGVERRDCIFLPGEPRHLQTYEDLIILRVDPTGKYEI